MKLYRAMREAADGLPEVGPTARTLGVRPGGSTKSDVAAINDQDPVAPGGGGMSTAPDDPRHLIRFRRPPSLGGTGDDPVWIIDVNDLDPDLAVHLDTPKHAVDEPIRPMTLQSFQAALARTRDRWAVAYR